MTKLKRDQLITFEMIANLSPCIEDYEVRKIIGDGIIAGDWATIKEKHRNVFWMAWLLGGKSSRQRMMMEILTIARDCDRYGIVDPVIGMWEKGFDDGNPAIPTARVLPLNSLKADIQGIATLSRKILNSNYGSDHPYVNDVWARVAASNAVLISIYNRPVSMSVDEMGKACWSRIINAAFDD